MAFNMAHTIRVGVLQGFSELVNEFSVDPDNLLQQCHIDTSLIDDDDSRIALDSMLKLLDLSATATHCEHFGLLLASKQESSFLGLVGLLMDSSPDLEGAFKKAIRSHSVHAQGTRWRLSTEGKYTSASIIFDSPVAINPRQGIELAVGQAFHIARTLSNNCWRPKQVCFRHQKPRNDAYYKRCFGVPIVFDSEFDGFYLSSGDLELPMPRKDERVHSALSEYADILTRDDKQDLCDQIKAAIRKLLPQGQCSIQAIASLMACDKRSLQRTLKQEGTSYQLLLDEVRFTMAQEHLRDSSMPLTNLAVLLGYTDVSSFSRAFKQQFGQSPSAWRKQNK
jgi:AraC-like DNA-binding protein